MNDKLFYAGLVGGIILIVALLVGLVVAPSYYFEKRACDVRADEMGRDARYLIIGGCFIQMDNGTYVNESKLRFLPDGSIISGVD